MLVECVSQASGRRSLMDLPITKQQLDRWNDGMPIQDAMPNLTAEQREFLMTGITPEEWEALFG